TSAEAGQRCDQSRIPGRRSEDSAPHVTERQSTTDIEGERENHAHRRRAEQPVKRTSKHTVPRSAHQPAEKEGEWRSDQPAEHCHVEKRARKLPERRRFWEKSIRHAVLLSPRGENLGKDEAAIDLYAAGKSGEHLHGNLRRHFACRDAGLSGHRAAALA